MAEEDGLALWRSIMGDSDDDSDTPFHGFTLEEVVKGGESDIDLGVVRQQDLREDFSDISSVSPVSASEVSSSEGDTEMPTLAPRKRHRKTQKKTQKRQTKAQRDQATIGWSDQVSEVKEETVFKGSAEDGKIGVSHDLPVDATPFDYFSLLLPEMFWSDAAEQTNVYAVQKHLEKGVDKYWKETTPEEMKIFIFVQFMFSIHHLPEASMYWSSDPLLRVSAMEDVISKNRFKKRSQYFHLNDNSKAAAKGDPNYDPLFKVRPLSFWDLSCSCQGHSCLSFWDLNYSFQGQGRLEEGDGPLQEESAGWSPAGPQSQRQFCLRFHWCPGGKAAMSRDLSECYRLRSADD